MGSVLDNERRVLEGIKRPIVLNLDVCIGSLTGNENASTELLVRVHRFTNLRTSQNVLYANWPSHLFVQRFCLFEFEGLRWNCNAFLLRALLHACGIEVVLGLKWLKHGLSLLILSIQVTRVNRVSPCHVITLTNFR